MLRLTINPPNHQPFILACSGGVDSMAAADFFLRGKKNFRLAYFHHNTMQADDMLAFVRNFANQNNLALEVGRLAASKPKGLSPEEFWRNERYAWLNSFNLPIVTCHHLNDVAETWLFSSLHGTPKILKPKNGKVISNT